MKEIWQNEKSRAGFTLGLWIIFIIIVILLSSCSGSKKEVLTNNVNEKINIETKINELLNDALSYKITYQLKDLSSKKIFDVSFKSDIYTGYLEDGNGITKFKCDLDKCFQVFLDHEEETDEYYFKDLLNIFAIKDISNKLVKENDSVYSYNENSIYYKVYLNDKKISKINIEDNIAIINYDINYNL